MKNAYIIITDDDQDDQEFLMEAIKSTNVKCDITCALDGTELMDILLKKNEHIDSTLKLPDLIILDLNMPLMDGYEVLKWMKSDENLKQIPVYILTTSQHEYDKVKSIAYGASGFYSKPMSSPDLLKIVKEIFALHPPLTLQH